ncbi:MAG: hypothetical protein GX898_07470 [Corynebacterium sp.]|nr:hypothetical protein [Corynebacterium sp.]
MAIPSPSSLSDVITDGILAQAGVDRAFAAQLGKIRGVEFNLNQAADNESADTPITVQVRINRAQGAPFDSSGTVVAWIHDGQFTWVSDRGAEFNIPELSGTHEHSDGLIHAARTLHGNAPAFIAPFPGRGQALVVLNVEPELGDVRGDLIDSLAELRPDLDAQRAITGYAAVRGLGVRRGPSYIALSDGTSVTLRNGHRPFEVSGGLSLRDVRADSAFSSAEHQLLFDALSPTHQVSYNPQTGTALIDGQHEVTALPLATIEDGQWRWAWDDQRVPGQVTEGLRRFGRDNGLLPLVTPALPVDQAEALDLTSVAKPILQCWTDVTIDSGAGFHVVLLLEHPRLHLPPASHAAVEATLYSRIDPALDARRAVAAYASQRQVPFDGSSLTIDGQQVTVEFSGNQIKSIS